MMKSREGKVDEPCFDHNKTAMQFVCQDTVRMAALSAIGDFMLAGFSVSNLKCKRLLRGKVIWNKKCKAVEIFIGGCMCKESAVNNMKIML